MKAEKSTTNGGKVAWQCIHDLASLFDFQITVHGKISGV